jgi:hypothetical protein
MSAGLPGFGLSGVFFVVSALLMVPIELVATLRGRSSLERWGRVLRSAGIALAILAGTELTYAAVHLAVTQLSGPASSAHSSSAQPGGRATDVVRAIPVLPIVGTVGLVVIVIAGAKAAEMLSDLRRRPAHPVANRSRPPLELHPVGEGRSTARPDTGLADLHSRPAHAHPQRAGHGGASRSAGAHQGPPAVSVAD